MKNLFYCLFAFFVSLALLYPDALNGQAFSHPNKYEIVNEDQDGIHIQSRSQQVKYFPQNYSGNENWDTLYISLNLSGPEIYVIGPFYNYLEYDFTWVTGTLAYILLNSEHQFQIAVRWRNEYNTYVVLKEDYSISSTDTLEFSTQDAVYELEMHPVDQNGISFNQLDGEKGSEIHIMVPQGLGYYPIQELHYDLGTTYISELSEDCVIKCSSIFYDVEIENTSCYIEFPDIIGMNQNHYLENLPEDYVHTNLQMYITNEDVETTAVGFVCGIQYIDNNGVYSYFAGGKLNWIDPTEFWNGNLYLSKPETENIRNYVYLASTTYVHSQPYTRCESPNLEVINDSISAFYGMFPTYGLYKAGDYDTLFFGEGPTTFWYGWLNNSWGSIAGYGDSYGIMSEYIRPINEMSNYKIKDGNGNIIFEENQSTWVEYNNAVPGNYTVEITNTSSPIKKRGNGSSRLIANFNYGEIDADPPSLSPVQFRDNSNKPTFRVKSGEELTLLFCAADFNDTLNSVFGFTYFLYQPILNDSTKAFVREYGSEDWQELVIQNYHEDTIAGFYYKSELSAYTQLDSSALDLKIKILDYSGNSAEYTISPAILIDDFVITNIETNNLQSDNLEVNIFPNPARKSLTINDNIGNGVKSITIMDVAGNVIKQYNQNNNEFDISDIKEGIYFVKIIIEEKIIIKKIIILN